MGRWAAPDVRALGCFGLVAVVARVLEGGSRLTLAVSQKPLNSVNLGTLTQLVNTGER